MNKYIFELPYGTKNAPALQIQPKMYEIKMMSLKN